MDRLRAQTKNGGSKAAVRRSWVLPVLCRGGLGVLFLARLVGDGAAVEALGVDVAVDELDHGDRGVVAVAEAGLEDADIAALAVLVARAEDGEELSDLGLVADLADRLTAGMEIATLADVISFSTIGRSSLALGSVVTICSCLISAADMLANIALRWAEVRLSLRFASPWRIF